MAKVTLHVYDVTNCASPSTNDVIIRLNKITRDAMGFGGIFHGGVEIYGLEWSFGYCERGSGVFSMSPKYNPLYTYRETIELGVTLLDEKVVNHILVKLSRAWDGQSYDLLARNCNHFCDDFCQNLGVGPIPGWVNRFALAADAAVEAAGSTAAQIRILQESVARAFTSLWSPRESEKELRPRLQAPPSHCSLGEVSKLCLPSQGCETYPPSPSPYPSPPYLSRVLREDGRSGIFQGSELSREDCDIMRMARRWRDVVDSEEDGEDGEDSYGEWDKSDGEEEVWGEVMLRLERQDTGGREKLGACREDATGDSSTESAGVDDGRRSKIDMLTQQIRVPTSPIEAGIVDGGARLERIASVYVECEDWDTVDSGGSMKRATTWSGPALDVVAGNGSEGGKLRGVASTSDAKELEKQNAAGGKGTSGIRWPAGATRPYLNFVDRNPEALRHGIILCKIIPPTVFAS